MSGARSILFVDAYDSFTRNIIALLYKSIPFIDIVEIQIDTDVQQRYGIGLSAFVSKFDAIVIGPGPGDPRKRADVGLIEDVLDVAVVGQIPVLGICLGFQTLCLRYGYDITPLPLPCHGQTKRITSWGNDIFSNLRSGPESWMMCYNSLGVKKASFENGFVESTSSSSRTSPSSSGASTPSLLPSDVSDKTGELELLAWDDDGFVMAVKHPLLPFRGLQFHPESCMCYDGEDLMRNWWTAIEAQILQNSNWQQVQPPEVSHHLETRISTDGSTESSMMESLQMSKQLPGKVAWSMSKFDSLSFDRLSQLCYNSAPNGVVVMLESVQKGRYCIYPFPERCYELVHYANGKLVLTDGECVRSAVGMSVREALEQVQNITTARACIGGCPLVPFWGGLIGFCSYEMGLDLVGVPSSDSRNVADFSFLFVERSVVFDQQTGNICVQSIKNNDEPWVRSMSKTLKRLNEAPLHPPTPGSLNWLQEVLRAANITVPDHSVYTSQIKACQQQLHAGNSYELCLTGEGWVPLPAPHSDTSYNLYQNLIKHNPVPFAAFLQFPGLASDQTSPRTTFPGTTILSTSPEQFLSWSRSGTLDMIPMKGTVQRTPATNMEDVISILSSPKETAENLMIADLIRHDLYGVVGCRPQPHSDALSSSIKPVKDPLGEHKFTIPSQDDEANICNIEQSLQDNRSTRDPLSIRALNTIKQFDTVYQLVSHIRAEPPSSLDANDLNSVIAHNHSSLPHVLPPGSMTGAPKKRSCEILQDLEQRNRGVYSGIIGYMDVGGGGCWSVAIRTAFSSEDEDYVSQKHTNEGAIKSEKTKVWRVGAGGAVTVLSDVEGEWEEMMGKMGNVLEGFKDVKQDMPVWKNG